MNKIAQQINIMQYTKPSNISKKDQILIQKAFNNKKGAINCILNKYTKNNSECDSSLRTGVGGN